MVTGNGRLINYIFTTLLSTKVDGKFTEVDGNFTAVDGNFTAVDGKFTEVDVNFSFGQAT